MAARQDVVIIGLIRNRMRFRGGAPTTDQADDILVVEAGPKEIDRFVKTHELELVAPTRKGTAFLRTDEIALSEPLLSRARQSLAAPPTI